MRKVQGQARKRGHHFRTQEIQKDDRLQPLEIQRISRIHGRIRGINKRKNTVRRNP